MKHYIILLIILVVLLTGCNSRKSSVLTGQTSIDSTQQIKQDSKVSMEVKEDKSTEVSVSERLLDFKIKPIEGNPLAKFIFIHEGRTIQGETTGELVFSNSEKNTTENTRSTTLQKIQYVSKITYKTHTTFRDKWKDKQTDKKATTWNMFFLGLLLGGLGITAIPLLWKAIKPI